MSKVNLEVLSRSKNLVKGLKTNYELAKGVGIGMDDIIKLETMVIEGEKLNKQLDDLRRETCSMVAETTVKLNEIKKFTIYLKQIIKRKYDNTQWKDFGILDKK